MQQAHYNGDAAAPLRQKDAAGRLLTKSNDDIDADRSAANNRYWISGRCDGKTWLTQADVDAMLSANPMHVQDVISGKIAAVNDELTASGLRPLHVRANSVMAINTLIDVPQEWWDSHGDDERRKFFNAAVAFCDGEYGRENRVMVSQHHDERSKRMHVDVVYVPITPDRRLSAKDLCGGPSEMRRRQERYYEQVASHFGMPRPDHGARTKHLDSRAYKMAAEMAKEKAKEILQRAGEKAAEILRQAEADADARRQVINEAEAVVAKLRQEAEAARQKAMEKHKEAVDRLVRIDAYFREVDALLPGLLDALKRGEQIDRDKYAALFRARERMRELEISRSRDFRRIEDRLKELVLKRDAIGRI